MKTLSDSATHFIDLKSITPQEEKPEYYASDISERLGHQSKADFESMLNSTMQVFSALHLSVKRNFKQIFRFRNGEMVVDWKLSPLACYLMALNGNPEPLTVGKTPKFFPLHPEN